MSDKRDLLVQGLLSEPGNESPEHIRMRTKLDRLAAVHGYTQPYQGFDRSHLPDVLRTTPDGKSLICVDAKVAKNEGPGRSPTVNRLIGYVSECYSRLQFGGVETVFIGITTNDERSAKGWAISLNLYAMLVGDWGNPPDFQVAQLDWETWLVYWVAERKR